MLPPTRGAQASPIPCCPDLTSFTWTSLLVVVVPSQVHVVGTVLVGHHRQCDSSSSSASSSSSSPSSSVIIVICTDRRFDCRQCDRSRDGGRRRRNRPRQSSPSSSFVAVATVDRLVQLSARVMRHFICSILFIDHEGPRYQRYGPFHAGLACGELLIRQAS